MLVLHAHYSLTGSVFVLRGEKGAEVGLNEVAGGCDRCEQW